MYARFVIAPSIPNPDGASDIDIWPNMPTNDCSSAGRNVYGGNPDVYIDPAFMGDNNPLSPNPAEEKPFLLDFTGGGSFTPWDIPPLQMEELELELPRSRLTVSFCTLEPTWIEQQLHVQHFLTPSRPMVDRRDGYTVHTTRGQVIPIGIQVRVATSTHPSLPRSVPMSIVSMTVGTYRGRILPRNPYPMVVDK